MFVLSRFQFRQLLVGGGDHWCLTFAWLPALLVAEIVRPRLSYNVRRWSTVFPLGMYAVCSFTVGGLSQISGILDFAKVWVWVALAVWLLVFTAMLLRLPELTRGSVRPEASSIGTG